MLWKLKAEKRFGILYMQIVVQRFRTLKGDLNKLYMLHSDLAIGNHIACYSIIQTSQ